jgi:hypothetical protein
MTIISKLAHIGASRIGAKIVRLSYIEQMSDKEWEYKNPYTDKRILKWVSCNALLNFDLPKGTIKRSNSENLSPSHYHVPRMFKPTLSKILFVNNNNAYLLFHPCLNPKTGKIQQKINYTLHENGNIKELETKDVQQYIRPEEVNPPYMRYKLLRVKALWQLKVDKREYTELRKLPLDRI